MFIPLLSSDIRRTQLKALVIFLEVYLQVSDREKKTEELAKWSPFSVVQVLERELNQGLYLTAVHRLRLDISKPDSQVGREALSSQLKHGNVAATVQVERVDDGDRGDRVPDGAHPLVERVLHLVRRDDRPVGAVVQHLLVRLLRARRRLR